jgi:uncharacterized alkaline shock family protein YloU
MANFKKRVSITEQVISSIAGIAASEVEGMSGLRGNVADNIKAILGDEGRRRGVITKEEDGKVHITMHVAVEYGYPIHEVAQKLQVRVKAEVEAMTALYVSGVDIFVSDLTIPEQEERIEGLTEELPGSDEIDAIDLPRSRSRRR